MGSVRSILNEAASTVEQREVSEKGRLSGKIKKGKTFRGGKGGGTGNVSALPSSILQEGDESSTVEGE